MAKLRRLGNLAGTLFDQYVTQQNQDHESALIAQRQREAAAQASQVALFNKILADPTGQMVEKLRKAGAENVAGMPLSALAHDRNDAAGEIGGEIAKASDLAHLQTPADIVSGYNGAAGASNAAPDGDVTTIQKEAVPFTGLGGDTGMNGLLPTPKRTAIEDLMAQRNAKEQGLKSSVQPVKQSSIGPDGTAQDEYVNPWEAAGKAYQTERTGTQEGVRKGAEAVAAAPGVGGAKALQNDITRPGEVKTEGQKAGARAAAEFPWQKKITQIRADMKFENDKRETDWRNAHPKLTAEQLSQHSAAAHAVTLTDEVTQLFNEMDKRGLIGAVKGRGAQLAAGTIKAEDLFKNPDDAQLASQFFSEMGFLSKLAAKVHGGTRAAASPQMAAAFDKLISGVGDRSIVQGQLDSVKRVMQIYQDDPNVPPLLKFPGGETGGPPPGADPLATGRRKLGL